MIFIILFLHSLATLHANALPTPAGAVSVAGSFVNLSPSCRDLGSCRELSSIITSCITTIFACVWFAQHPDVPPSLPGLAKLVDTARKTIVLLIIPDRMIVNAILQFLAAGALAKELNDIPEKAGQEKKTGPEGVAGGGSEVDRYVLTRQRHEEMDGPGTASPEKRRTYTRRDGFFVVMRGLHFYGSDNTPIRPLTIKDVTNLAKRGIFVIPSTDEIDDRSKASWTTKGLALIQTVSFAAQCVARLVLRLPTTELELTALAYTTITVVAYCFWWHKPVSIGTPVRVPILDTQATVVVKPRLMDQFHKNIWREWSLTFYTKRSIARIRRPLLLIAITTVLASAFGAIHCIYLWTSSGYWRDQNTWYNYSAIVVTLMPVAIGVCFTLIFLMSMGNRKYMVIRVLVRLFMIALFIMGFAYEVVRFSLFYFALAAFVFPQDPAVYQVPVWSTHMPNI
ncbi:hypothetical protein FIBSPDRAFT_968268 [Athelia psychrophila]|uniref:Uncharacterized protein n=1 Tax=Athelia psychrophila TaxID=1759441 RepID=A0A167UTG9_9AGAM|nr:hypothetical protein FIBSPDRAFT_968268 [Fibularhizoctonia sp. CBS 109695]